MNDLSNRSTTLLVILMMLLLSVVVLSPVGCTVHRNSLLSEAAEKGQDPLRARCAMTMGGSRDPICIVLAAQGEGGK